MPLSVDRGKVRRRWQREFFAPSLVLPLSTRLESPVRLVQQVDSAACAGVGGAWSGKSTASVIQGEGGG